MQRIICQAIHRRLPLRMSSAPAGLFLKTPPGPEGSNGIEDISWQGKPGSTVKLF
jgi:hypothetical protein